MPQRCADRAFTLIELLVVIAIIGVIAGMVLAAYKPLREAQFRSRTVYILTIASNALTAGALEHGSLPQAAEHPLAGSKQPRLAFYGMRGGWGAVSTTGEALGGVDVSRVEPAAISRLLLPDDRFAETDHPTFYGTRREDMGVFGAPQANLTRLLNLAPYGGSGVIPSTDLNNMAKGYLPFDDRSNTADTSGDGSLPGTSPYVTTDALYPSMSTGNPRFPRDRFLISGTTGQTRRMFTKGGWPRTESWQVSTTSRDTESLFARFVASGLLDELRGLKALSAPDTGTHGQTIASWSNSAYTDYLFVTGGIVAGPSVPAGWDSNIAHTKLNASDSLGYGEVGARSTSFRLVSSDPGKPSYEPGRLKDGAVWKTWHLRGLALYDAWGTEILYVRTGERSFRLTSAGRDRCFTIRPAADGTFATSMTTPYTGSPSATDGDATVDNISTDKF